MKIKAREALLLTVPVCLLVGVGILLRKPGPPLVVEKATVVTLPGGSRDFFEIPDIKTKVNLVVRYNGPSLYKHLITGLHWNEISGNGYLVDQHGKKYVRHPYRFATPQGDGVINGLRPRLDGYLGRQRYLISFPVPLFYIPKSAGRVTLKAKLTLNHEWSIPVSVVVRK